MQSPTNSSPEKELTIARNVFRLDVLLLLLVAIPISFFTAHLSGVCAPALNSLIAASGHADDHAGTVHYLAGYSDTRCGAKEFRWKFDYLAIEQARTRG